MKTLKLILIIVFSLGIMLMNIESVSARGFSRHLNGKHYNYGHHNRHNYRSHSRRHFTRHVPRHSYVNHGHSRRHFNHHIPRHRYARSKRRYYKYSRYGNYYSFNRAYSRKNKLSPRRRRAKSIRLYTFH